MKRGLVNKKGLSPIVATSILILIVIILAIIILLWARGFVGEAVIKEIAGSEKRAEDFCREIKMKGIVNDDDTFGFENIGNVPIFAYKVQTENDGNVDVHRVDNNQGGSVNPGFSVIARYSSVSPYSAYESVKIIPILLGKTDGSTQEFECPEINGILI